MGGALGLHAARKDGRDELHCTRPDCPRCRTLLAMRGDAVLASSVHRPYDGNPNEYKSDTLPPPPGCARGAPTEHELERRRKQAAKERRAEAARRRCNEDSVVMQYIRPVFTDEEVRRAEARAQKEAREREVAEKKAAEIAAAEAAVEAARLAAYRAEVAKEERERAEAAARKRKEAEDRARRKPDKVKAKLAMREIIPKLDRAWSRTYSHDTAAVQRFMSSVYPKPKAHARPPLLG